MSLGYEVGDRIGIGESTETVESRTDPEMAMLEMRQLWYNPYQKLRQVAQLHQGRGL